MKEKDKKKLIYKISKKIFLILFIGFTVLYFTEATGYYDYKLHEKVVLNDEKIKQFEKDIKDGKNINVDDYVKEDTTDYGNSISKIGLELSSNIGGSIKNGVNGMFKYLSKMVEE